MDFVLFNVPPEIFFTCKDSTRLCCHVNLVLPGDALHHGFGPPVVLGGQQPAQRLGKNPAEREKGRDGKDMERTDKEG